MDYINLRMQTLKPDSGMRSYSGDMQANSYSPPQQTYQPPSLMTPPTYAMPNAPMQQTTQPSDYTYSQPQQSGGYSPPTSQTSKGWEKQGQGMKYDLVDENGKVLASSSSLQHLKSVQGSYPGAVKITNNQGIPEQPVQQQQKYINPYVAAGTAGQGAPKPVGVNNYNTGMPGSQTAYKLPGGSFQVQKPGGGSFNLGTDGKVTHGFNI